MGQRLSACLGGQTAALGDGVDAPRRHLCAKVTVSNCHLKEASVEHITTIGLDIAKHVFHAHGADAAGQVLLRKRLTRAKLLGFFAAQAPCVVAMEACAGSHYWAREIGKLGHTMRLIPPAYVKPFVKRQKNDAADAEAICEAAQRPSMRFVPVKDLLRSWPRPFGGEGRIRTYDAACTA